MEFFIHSFVDVATLCSCITACAAVLEIFPDAEIFSGLSRPHSAVLNVLPPATTRRLVRCLHSSMAVTEVPATCAVALCDIFCLDGWPPANPVTTWCRVAGWLPADPAVSLVCDCIEGLQRRCGVALCNMCCLDGCLPIPESPQSPDCCVRGLSRRDVSCSTTWIVA